MVTMVNLAKEDLMAIQVEMVRMVFPEHQVELVSEDRMVHLDLMDWMVYLVNLEILEHLEEMVSLLYLKIIKQ